METKSIKVCVASENPVKINSVKEAFTKMFPGEIFMVEGLSASSDVSDQPMSDDETFKGALNRTNNLSEKIPADYWVGIEGGMQKKGAEFEAFNWVVVKSKTGKLGKARSATYFLPEAVSKLIREGKELAHASNTVFNENEINRKQGTVGMLTGNVVDRTNLSVEPVILALIPFKNKDLY
jgi:inosine/xanthosine triphosphatase